MGKTIGAFRYRILAPQKGAKPFSPIVYIELGDHSADENGWPRVSPQLMTEREIDGQVEALKADLDHVGNLAKNALRRAKLQTLGRIRDSRTPGA